MKKIILWVVILIVILASIVILTSKEQQIDEEKTFSINDKTKINVKTDKTKVIVTQKNINEIKVNLSGKEKVPFGKAELEVNESNDSLDLKIGGKSLIVFEKSNVCLYIDVPETYNGDLVIETNKAGISYSCKELKNNLKIANDLGKIDVDVPSNSDFVLNTKRSIGGISNDFDSDGKNSSRNGNEKIGDGKYMVDISTNIGEININKK